MFNALTSMGGGVSDQAVLSDSAAALYAIFAIASLAAPVACAHIGPRATLALGTLGYSAYVASLAAYQHLGADGWMVVAGGGVNGLSAGLLWTAQVRRLPPPAC